MINDVDKIVRGTDVWLDGHDGPRKVVFVEAFPIRQRDITVPQDAKCVVLFHDNPEIVSAASVFVTEWECCRACGLRKLESAQAIAKAALELLAKGLAPKE